jgi:hypothetical protein
VLVMQCRWNVTDIVITRLIIGQQIYHAVNAIVTIAVKRLGEFVAVNTSVDWVH